MKIIGLLALAFAALVRPAAPQSGCMGPDGNRFNLEPRPRAVVQVAQSIAVLPGAGSGGVDLLLGTGTDMRGIGATTNAFYVQRANPDCAADLEGGLPEIQTPDGFFGGLGTPIAVADRAHSAIFVADLRFGGRSENAVGILRTSPAALLNATTCPDGTQTGGSAGCFTVAAVANVTTLNAFLGSPHIGVDPRTAGVGAGDVYIVVAQHSAVDSSESIQLTACTNRTLKCGASTVVSGADLNADFPFVQVRPDGEITVTYRNTTFPNIHPEDIKYATCTPQGAPNPPVCSAAGLVLTESQPVFASSPGDVPMLIDLYPRHLHRLEADGHSVTTFLVYDRCGAPVQQRGLGAAFCPKSEVAFTASTDNGASWSPLAKVTAAAGQQFFSAAALDQSTGVVSIAYYSTENDLFLQRAQVFLVQISAGTPLVSDPHMLTANTADSQATSPETVLFQPTGFGDRIGIDSTGSGVPGQSRVYVGFTWNRSFGIYAGKTSADMNNHLIGFTF